MATTTPATDPKPRSASHSRTRSGQIPSRPTTPLRPPSRTSLRASQNTTPSAGQQHPSTSHPLTALEPAFSEFSDSMADLEANMLHLQLLSESLNRFNETFGAFLYGMNMSAFCVDFPEAPIGHSFVRNKEFGNQMQQGQSPFVQRSQDAMVEATFLTTDTSFVENPPTSSKPASKFSSVPPSSAASARQTRGGAAARAGRSGIARGNSTRGGAAGRAGRGGSGIARGVGRGRVR